MNYNDALMELEQILSELQKVPTDIDLLEARVKRARELVVACRSKLRGLDEALNNLDESSYQP